MIEKPDIGEYLNMNGKKSCPPALKINENTVISTKKYPTDTV